MLMKGLIQMANETRPVHRQSAGRSSQGVSELSKCSSTRASLSPLCKGPAVSSGSACCCLLLTWVYLTLSCPLPVETRSTRPNMKIKCEFLLLLAEEAAFGWEMGPRFSGTSGSRPMVWEGLHRQLRAW